jgi:hypothetical protein
MMSTTPTRPGAVKLADIPEPRPSTRPPPPPPPGQAPEPAAPFTRPAARRPGDPPRQPVEEQPVARPSKTTLSTQVYYRGRWITVACEGMTLESFSDLLDARGIPREEEPNG